MGMAWTATWRFSICRFSCSLRYGTVSDRESMIEKVRETGSRRKNDWRAILLGERASILCVCVCVWVCVGVLMCVGWWVCDSVKFACELQSEFDLISIFGATRHNERHETKMRRETNFLRQVFSFWLFFRAISTDKMHFNFVLYSQKRSQLIYLNCK